MACYERFGNLADGRPFFAGNFLGTGWLSFDRQLLFYSPGDFTWWLGTFSSGGQLTWTLAGNTAGFGDLADGRPFWTGKFEGTGATSVLFYTPGDHNWWLGSFSSGGQLSWKLVGNTAGFGGLADGRPFFVGDFNGTGGTDILFYSPSDFNWWLGSLSGGQLTWTLVGNTAVFGDVYDGRPFWTGYFSGYSRAQVLFYSPGDSNWWLGSFNPSGSLAWQLAGNTSGFGPLDDGRPFWMDDFNADLRDDLLFHYPGDGNWWLGTFSSGGQLTWQFVGNTTGFGTIWPGGRFWSGYFSGVFKADLLFYQPSDGNWWLGTLVGSQIKWQLVGNTTGFGNINKFPFWKGFFKGSGGFDVVFYSSGDGNWWLGSITGGQLTWTLATNTGRPFARRVRVHFKLLANPTAATLATHFQDLKSLLAGADILVEQVSIENLTAPNPAIDPLRDLNVADCQWNIWPWPTTTAAQDALFANRNGAETNEIVVYIVRTLVGSAPAGFTIFGCATYPGDRPGCAVARAAPRFVIAHEVGHVLGLGHVNNTDRLMNPTASWTNLPPDIDSGEGSWMRGNALALQCL
jgi:Matrixin